MPFAASCENYPDKIGINYIESNGKFKIISSTEVVVEFDDQETYLDAMLLKFVSHLPFGKCHVF